MLHLVSHGRDVGTPLIIAHGLFGSGRNWGIIAKRLSDSRRVITLDLRNHGASPWQDDHSYPSLAEDLIEVIASVGGPVDLLGHSMGGKAAMVAALLGANIRRLIVADIAPVTYNHTQQHLIDAMQSLPLDRLANRAEAEQALSSQIEHPAVRSFLLQSLNLPDQSWRLNLTALSTNMEKIISFPNISGQFNALTLFLTGANSNYLLPEYHLAISSLFPKAHFAKIANAGHWLHAEKPREFEATVRGFLDA